jgi:arylsulfatase A-like enzyme
MRLPGRVGAGVSSEEPVATIDLYPTIIDLAGLAPAQELDGQSLAPLLAKPQTSLGRAALYWHFPHYLPGRQAPAGATREGRYKLIESFGDDRLELYDLSADPGEQRNLASEQSERAASLRAKLAAWRSSVAAAMPSSKDPPRPATALRNSSP